MTPFQVPSQAPWEPGFEGLFGVRSRGSQTERFRDPDLGLLRDPWSRFGCLGDPGGHRPLTFPRDGTRGFVGSGSIELVTGFDEHGFGSTELVSGSDDSGPGSGSVVSSSDSGFDSVVSSSGSGFSTVVPGSGSDFGSVMPGSGSTEPGSGPRLRPVSLDDSGLDVPSRSFWRDSDNPSSPFPDSSVF